ncbi:hypothetical protein LSPH24S_09104 [Lysinibacillus sphaericus]
MKGYGFSPSTTKVFLKKTIKKPKQQSKLGIR